jgi:hypothetical protein
VYACFASSLTVTAAAPIVNAPPAISSLLRLLLLGPERALGPAFALPASPAGAFALLPKPSTLVANLLSACTLVATTLRWGIACLCDREHARHVHDGTVPPLRSNGERLCSADIYRIFISLNWGKKLSGKRHEIAPDCSATAAARVVVVRPTFSRRHVSSAGWHFRCCRPWARQLPMMIALHSGPPLHYHESASDRLLSSVKTNVTRLNIIDDVKLRSCIHTVSPKNTQLLAFRSIWNPPGKETSSIHPQMPWNIVDSHILHLSRLHPSGIFYLQSGCRTGKAVFSTINKRMGSRKTQSPRIFSRKTLNLLIQSHSPSITYQ